MDILKVGLKNARSLPAAGRLISSETEGLDDPVLAARMLNDLNVEDREFSVVRDEESRRFVVIVRARGAGAILAQFPAENIMRMLVRTSASA